MRSNLVKLFRSADGSLTSFFFKSGSLYAAGCSYDKSDTVCTVSADATPCFSLAVYNGNPLIISRKVSGAVYISKYNGTNWSEKPFLKSLPGDNTSLCLNISSGSSYLLFNSPLPQPGIESLSVAAFRNKAWQSPVVIDNIVPFAATPYIPVTIGSGHLLLLYRTKSSPLVLKELSLNPLKTGAAVPVFAGNLNITDISVIICGGKIHICVTARFGRIFKLIYIRRDENGFGSAKILWECARIDNCSIFYADNKLHIMCISGKTVFCTESADSGSEFCPVYRLKNPPQRKIIKAEYIAAIPSEKSIYTEIFVYADNPAEAVLVQDIDPLFTSADTVLKASEAGTASSLNEELNIYKNRAEYYEKRFNEANKKLGEMSKALTKRSEELYTLNSRWTVRFNELKSCTRNHSSGTAIVPVVPQSPPPEECSR